MGYTSRVQSDKKRQSFEFDEHQHDLDGANDHKIDFEEAVEKFQTS